MGIELCSKAGETKSMISWIIVLLSTLPKLNELLTYEVKRMGLHISRYELSISQDTLGRFRRQKMY
ncbi:MAG: hypothetical protein CL912_14600 [Deltaproteobacteria bacterium]|nr:hypothetical protein [Deltaproteobacteria bacterium]